jgi:hypothetical protein
LEHYFGEPSDKNNSGQKHSFGYLNLLHRQLRERERERERTSTQVKATCWMKHNLCFGVWEVAGPISLPFNIFLSSSSCLSHVR